MFLQTYMHAVICQEKELCEMTCFLFHLAAGKLKVEFSHELC